MDEYIIFHKGKVAVSGDKKDLYNEDLYKYIKCPKIISFIKMVKDKDINLSNYLDINELIKGIYRSVEGKWDIKQRLVMMVIRIMAFKD